MDRFVYKYLVDSDKNREKGGRILTVEIPEDRIHDGILIRVEPAFKFALIEKTNLKGTIPNLIGVIRELEGPTKEPYHLHEIVPAYARQKIRFDLDMKGITEERAQQVLEDVLTGIISASKEAYDYSISLADDIAVCSSHGEGKYSYHVMVTGFCVGNCFEAQAFHKLAMKSVSEQNMIYVDQNVNKPYQSLRLLGATKLDSDRFKRMDEGFTYKRKYYYTRIKTILPNDYAVFHYQLTQTLLTFTEGMEMKYGLAEEDRGELKKQPQLKNEFVKTILNMIAHKLELENYEDPDFPFKFREIRGREVWMDRIREGVLCSFCDRPHDHDYSYVRVQNNNYVYYVCGKIEHGDSQSYMKGRVYLGQLKGDPFKKSEDEIQVTDKLAPQPTTSETPIPVEILPPEPLVSELNELLAEVANYQYSPPKPPTAKEKAELRAAKYRVQKEYLEKLLVKEESYLTRFDSSFTKVEYCERYNRELNPDYEINLVQAAMGTGKTTALVRFLRQFPKAKVLVVTARRTFAASINKVLNREVGKFENYLDRNLNSNRLVIQVESLHKITKKYDILVLDEMTSILKQFFSPNHQEQDLTRKMMVKLTQDAKHVIGMDADFDDRIFEFLNDAVRFRKIYLQTNTFQFPKRFYRMGSKQALINKMRSELAEGKKIHVVLGTTSLGAELESLWKSLNYRYLYFHSDGDDHKQILEEINEYIVRERIQIFMHTSTITNGIDINVEHFDTQFIYGSNRSCCVREFKQMSGRVRKLAENVVYFYNDVQTSINAVTVQGVTYQRNAMLQLNQQLAKQLIERDSEGPEHVGRKLHNFEIDIKADAQGNYIKFVNAESIWGKQLVRDIVEYNRSYGHFNTMFDYLFRKDGHEILDYEDNVKEDLPEIPESMLNEPTAEDEFNGLPLLEEDLLGKIQRKVDSKNATRIEKLTLYKNRIVKKFRTEHAGVVDYTFFERYYNGAVGGGHLHNRALELNRTAKAQALFDAAEASERPKFMELKIVEIVLRILGLESSTDVEHTFTKDQILRCGSYFTENEAYFKSTYKKVFQFDSLKGATAGIRTVLNHWCGSDFSSKEVRKRTGGGRTYSYVYSIIPFKPTGLDNDLNYYLEKLEIY